MINVVSNRTLADPNVALQSFSCIWAKTGRRRKWEAPGQSSAARIF